MDDCGEAIAMIVGGAGTGSGSRGATLPLLGTLDVTREGDGWVREGLKRMAGKCSKAGVLSFWGEGMASTAGKHKYRL